MSIILLYNYKWVGTMVDFDYKIWKEMNNIDDSMPLHYNAFIDDEDKWLFEEYISNPSSVLMEMANALGNNIKKEKRLPFSFYFSSKKVVKGVHGIRVKILWNPSKMGQDSDGYMELHGDYDYISGSKRYKPSNNELGVARRFFKKYKVLFVAVWEDIIQDPSQLTMYLYGKISWKELMKQFDTGNQDWNFLITTSDNEEELEQLVREEGMFNMND